MQISFIVLGLCIGVLGTLVGAGGGFILLPILLWAYPEKSPEEITAISMAVIFFNAFSGSIAYARLKKIHYKAGCFFSLGAIPGCVLGVYCTKFLDRIFFDRLAYIFLLCVALFLMWRSSESQNKKNTEQSLHHLSSAKVRWGMLLSVFVGFISSLLGIGGGIIHVPALIYLLNFPVHYATATSHFVLAITSFLVTGMHFVDGALSVDAFWNIVLFLALGVVVGAQIGAKISTKIHPKWIIRGLSSAIILVCLRMILS